MRVAALYDVHGNLPALEAVLADVAAAAPDAVVFGGDLFAGPFPHETIALARTIAGARYVRGNADRELDDGRPDAAWVSAQLTEEDREFVAGFEPTVTLDLDGLGPVLFCHAVPGNDTDILTVETPDDAFRAAFADAPTPTVVCGHTHTQYDRSANGVRVVNAGSVGMPYEARPGAYWALLGPDVELRRTDFDLDAAAARIRSSAWPSAEAFAVENVLAVPSAEEAAAFFEQAAGRRP